MATPSDPGREAWILLRDLSFSIKPRMLALAGELDLTPMQMHALRLIEPGAELPMSALAEWLHCDASNVTGIVDRLEARGLIERRSAAGDRRVKILVVTPDGEKLRELLVERFDTPPEEIASLSRSEQRALRDLLQKASAPEGVRV
jgi:MarR family transcriptional regulator, organic hydroperoxide resistance regulator